MRRKPGALRSASKSRALALLHGPEAGLFVRAPRRFVPDQVRDLRGSEASEAPFFQGVIEQRGHEATPSEARAGAVASAAPGSALLGFPRQASKYLKILDFSMGSFFVDRASVHGALSLHLGGKLILGRSIETLGSAVTDALLAAYKPSANPSSEK